MTKRTFSIFMASVAIFGSSMVGCSGAGMERHPLAMADKAQSLAPRIERLLDDKDYARALLLSEQFVEAQAEDGDARALLGRAYLANGRYVSARAAFADALTLGNRDPRTIVSLSLAETGLGDPAAARTLLATHIQDVPAADYGLAMAMAGDAQEAVRALLEAVKQPDASAKTRQNLAYALAMGGAWGQARLVAGQDLSARDAEKRMGQWAASFLEGKETDRVVAMIGIAPRPDDIGMPTALALNQTPETLDEPVAVASTDDFLERARAQLARSDEAPPVPARIVGPAPVALPDLAVRPVPAAIQVTSAPQPAAIAAAFAPQPIAGAGARPDKLRDAMQAAFRETAAPVAGRVNWVAAIAVPASDAEASDWVVQLGAFDSAAVARDKWQRIAAHRAQLGDFQAVNSVFAKDGRTYHRLAIRGFGDRAKADSTCAALKSFRQDCFVRLDDTQATRTARTEAQKGQSLAARDKPRDNGVSLATR